MNTKGPWHIKENGGKGRLVGIASERSSWFIAEEVLPEDAPLIAAAPELLEALESAMKVAEFESHPHRPWHHQAKAAIAKAKGESA